MTSFANNVYFRAGNSGTGSFQDGTAEASFVNMATGGTTTRTYAYKAASNDGLQWEWGRGVYTSGSPGTLTRVPIASSNGGAAVNFTAAPLVMLVVLEDDLLTEAERTKLAGIEAAADVTDAENVAAAGAVMDGDFGSNGLMVRTAAGTYANRSVAAGTGVAVTNGDGVSGNPSVAVDKATDANVRAAASNKVITADLIESASAAVALTAGSAIAVDWDTGINFTLTTNQNCTLSNPTNGQPGTWRSILVTNGASHTMAYGNQYVFPNKTPPVITPSSGLTRLNIFCRTASIFEVYSALDIGV